MGNQIKQIDTEIKITLTLAKIGYRVDFRCIKPDDSVYWVEAKGHPDKTWAIKKKLWLHYGPGPLFIYSGHYARPELIETIVPLVKL